MKTWTVRASGYNNNGRLVDLKKTLVGNKISRYRLLLMEPVPARKFVDIGVSYKTNEKLLTSGIPFTPQSKDRAKSRTLPLAQQP